MAQRFPHFQQMRDLIQNVMSVDAAVQFFPVWNDTGGVMMKESNVVKNNNNNSDETCKNLAWGSLSLEFSSNHSS